MLNDWSSGCAPELAQARARAEMAAAGTLPVETAVAAPAPKPVEVEAAPEAPKLPEKPGISKLDLLPDEDLIALAKENGVTLAPGTPRAAILTVLAGKGIK